MSTIERIGGVDFMPIAAAVLREHNRDVLRDLASLVHEHESQHTLLEKLHEAAPPEDHNGWRAYVQSLALYSGFMQLGVPVRMLASLNGGRCFCNDRGHKGRGPRYVSKLEGERVLWHTIKFVSEEQDPDAWRLAREAMEAHDVGGPNEPVLVAVGERTQPHQIIWAI